ncbi:hypothetical protein J437_LFUL014445, partial [Ladona fulva]
MTQLLKTGVVSLFTLLQYRKNKNQGTMEHADLVSEMSQVERMSTQDRLRQARHRRMQQLKAWSQREKEWMRRGGSNSITSSSIHPVGRRRIFFSDSVVLLEAAARNDVDE